MKAIRVEELMRNCGAATIPATATLRHAAETLVINNVSVLVAVDEDSTITGLVSEAAVIRQLMATPDRNESIGPILSRHIESVRATADLNSVLHLFRSSCHIVVPVVGPENEVIGLLHRGDVVRMLLENTSADQPHTDDDGPRPHFADRQQKSDPASSDASKSAPQPRDDNDDGSILPR